MRAEARSILAGRLSPVRFVLLTLSEWRLAATKGRELSMATNSIFLIVAKVAALGTGFLCWLLAARLFTASEVGLASAAVSATNLVAQLALLGIGSSVIGLFPKQSRPGALLDNAATLVGIASLLGAGVFLVVAAVALTDLRALAVDGRFVICFLAFGCAGTVGVLIDQTSTVIRRGDQAMTRNLLCGLVTLALIPLALVAVEGDRSVAIFAAWSIGAVAMVALGAWQLRRGTLGYRFRPLLRKELAWPLLTLGIPNHLLTLAERLPGAVLPILVTEVLSPAQNAYWYGVWMMSWVVFIIPIQIAITLYAEASHDPASLRRLVAQALRLSLGLGILAALVAVVFAGVALTLLGHAYAAAGELPLRIVVVAVVPMTVIEVYYGVCRSVRRLGEAVATGAVSAIAALVGAVLVAPGHGLVGIALLWLGVQAAASVWAGIRLVALVRSPRVIPTVTQAS